VLLHAYRLWEDFFSCSWLCMDIIIELCFMCEVFISSIKCVTFLATACIRNVL